jgi:hypothetical protein
VRNAMPACSFQHCYHYHLTSSVHLAGTKPKAMRKVNRDVYTNFYCQFWHVFWREIITCMIWKNLMRLLSFSNALYDVLRLWCIYSELMYTTCYQSWSHLRMQNSMLVEEGPTHLRLRYCSVMRFDVICASRTKPRVSKHRFSPH